MLLLFLLDKGEENTPVEVEEADSYSGGPVENIIISLNCVAPVFIMLMVGYILKRKKLVDEELSERVNRINLYVLLPILLFYNIYTADFSKILNWKLVIYALLQTTGACLLGFLIFWPKIRDKGTLGAFLQVWYRSNIVIVGMPLAQTLMGAENVAAMAVVIAFVAPLSNVLAVIILEICRGEKITARGLANSVAKSPLVMGCGLGILAQIFKIYLPEVILNVLGQVGNAGTTLAVLMLGATLDLNGARENGKLIILGSAGRLILVPLFSLSIAVSVGFRGDELAVILLTSATPLSTAAYSMAQAYGSNYKLTGHFVVSTSLLCCLTIFVWIFLLKESGIM